MKKIQWVPIVLALTLLVPACSDKDKKGVHEGGSDPKVDAPVVDFDAIPDNDCHFYTASDLGRYIRMGDVACVKKALVEGVDPNGDAVDSFFGTSTPYLSLALEDSSLFFMRNNQYGAPAAVALLLKYGGDANRRFQDGQTFLEKALRVSTEDESISLYAIHWATTNVTLQSGGGFPLEIAIDVARENLVQALLKRSANPNRFSRNASLVHQAVDKKLSESAKRLIESGADINAKNSESAPLVFRTIVMQQRDVFDLLMKKAAQLNTQDRQGTSPLMASVSSSDTPFMESLLAAGADVNAVDADGRIGR